MNHLQHETSPYLLQHADNPVEWHPWGDAALDEARATGRPILLSIGYSACHWCHVMAHESFEDAATAEVMNRLFVNIKVDREERPDLDKIYQAAHQLITRRNGGWPLTVFLTPDGQLPFFAGTYFPAKAQHGMPAFTDLLMRVAQHFEGNRDTVSRQAGAVIGAMASLEPGAADPDTVLDGTPRASLRSQLGENFDAEWGGFGDAPKFPHPTSLEFLLRYWRSSAHSSEPDVDALYMSALTLTRMLDGGIYDHLGGGFFRYSVDRYWSIPHFEKMLYDNGPLLALLAQLWQASGDDRFREATIATANWVLRDMRSPDGAFWSTLDADSESEEGKFYVWTPEEAAALTAPDEYAAFACHMGLDQAANFDDHWHLQVRNSLENSAAAAGVTAGEAANLLHSATTRLLTARNGRVWPARDEKILTAWNGLMIRGLAIAGRTLKDEDFVTAAVAALDFLRGRLVVDGRLQATCKDGLPRFAAYLDDHAFLLDATLELLQARWNSAHLEFAMQLADALLDKFQDKSGGGFYFTSEDHEKLSYRPRSFSDDSLPAGNAIAALALGRLGHLLGEPRYLEAAERTLRAGWPAMVDFPHGHAALIIALDEYLEPPEIVVIRGAAEEAAAWAQSAGALYAPRRLIFAVPADTTGLPGALATRRAADHCIAYVCRGTQCSAPVSSLRELARLLSEA